MTLPTPTKLREGKVMSIKTQHVVYNLAIKKKKKSITCDRSINVKIFSNMAAKFAPMLYGLNCKDFPVLQREQPSEIS